MVYRRTFGLSWAEMMEVPADVFFTDLEMISVENQIERLKSPKVK